MIAVLPMSVQLSSLRSRTEVNALGDAGCGGHHEHRLRYFCCYTAYCWEGEIEET